MENPLALTTTVNFNSPVTTGILLCTGNRGTGPDVQFHSAGVPFKPVSQFFSWTVSGPVLFGVRHIRKMICTSISFNIRTVTMVRTGPVREMKGKSLVTASPVIADTLVTLNDQSIDSEGFQTGTQHKTTVMVSQLWRCGGMANGKSLLLTTSYNKHLGFSTLQFSVNVPLLVP